MKVLYLFNGSRDGLREKVKTGDDHGNGFWGMLQLPSFGIEADYIEIEQSFPKWFTNFLRKFINIYFIHIPIFWKIFSYDIVFTSSAFGLQFFHTLFAIRKPIWVMHDFSIMSLIGDGKTFKQKVFRWMTSRARGIVTLSNDETDKLKKTFPHLAENIEMIPFGIDLNFFKPRHNSNPKGIIAVGFDPERDWKTFVEAVRGIDVPVTIATRESRITHLRPLPANISIKQFSANELVSAYDNAEIVVVPLNTSSGVNDAMGCSVLFEAMAMGKTVIATRTRATESYVTHGENGFLVPEGDSQKIREVVDMLLKNTELRMKIAQNAREYASQNLDIKKCTSKLAEFFKKVNTFR